MRSFPVFLYTAKVHLYKLPQGQCASNLCLLEFCFAVEGHLSDTGKELLAKLGLGAYIQVHISSCVAQTQHGASVCRYIYLEVIIIAIQSVHVSSAEDYLSYSACDRQQYKSHGHSHQKHHRFSLPGAQQGHDFVDPGSQISSDMYPVAVRD